MQAARKTVTEIHSVLDRFRVGYGKKDIRILLNLFAPDPDVTIIGTGEDEKRTGLDEIKRQFERDFFQSEELNVRFENISVSQLGSVCWVAGDTHVEYTLQGQAMQAYVRFTAVLENRNGKWLFVQTHFSVPFAEQVENSSLS